MTNAQVLLDAHHQLDFDCRDRRGRVFISDWYCEHPFIREIIPPTPMAPTSSDVANYYFQNDGKELHGKIQKFHERRNEEGYEPGCIFVSAGLTPLITAQMFMLRRRGIRKVYYVRPLYYTYYFQAASLGIELIAVNEEPQIAVNDQETLDLPTEPDQWLLLCDPVWYMGKPVSHGSIAQVREWQERTSGFVMVDGGFQYQKWNDPFGAEDSAWLIRDRTMRNVCPTKSVAVHGPRFAYSLIPSEMFEELRYCYSNTSGAGSIFDRDAANWIMDWLNRSESNAPLLTFMKNRHEALVSLGLIEDPLGAEASYFCFVKASGDPSRFIAMDEKFFDATGFAGYIRFNLLLPYRDLGQFVRVAMAARAGDIANAMERLQVAEF